MYLWVPLDQCFQSSFLGSFRPSQPRSLHTLVLDMLYVIFRGKLTVAYPRDWKQPEAVEPAQVRLAMPTWDRAAFTPAVGQQLEVTGVCVCVCVCVCVFVCTLIAA